MSTSEEWATEICIDGEKAALLRLAIALAPHTSAALVAELINAIKRERSLSTLSGRRLPCCPDASLRSGPSQNHFGSALIVAAIIRFTSPDNSSGLSGADPPIPCGRRGKRLVLPLLVSTRDLGAGHGGLR